MLSELLPTDAQLQFEALKKRLKPQPKAYQAALTAQENVAKLHYVTAPRHVVNLFGRSQAVLTLTPKAIRDVPLRQLGPNQPEVEFSMDLARVGRTSLESLSGTAGGQPISTGIHTPMIAFPPFCIACLNDVVSYQVVEVAVEKGSFGGKWSVNADQDTANRITKAALYDRYWIALPFCTTHAHRLESLDLSASGSSVTLAFGNLQYAALFQLLNPTLSGIYKSENCRRGENKSALIVSASIMALLVGLLFSIVFAVKATGFSWPGVIGFGSLAVLGVLGTVYGLRVTKQFDMPVPFKVD